MDLLPWPEFIDQTLNDLYPNPPIPLEHHSPYTLLIAVLLSAQCTDARVNLVTPQLFALADTPEKMIEQSVDRIKAIIRPCGLSGKKAQAIFDLSFDLVKLYSGQVPKSLEKLEMLSGVGHKTASVVMAQAFGEPMFPVDTHIHRLAFRWGLSNGKNVKQTEADLKQAFPKERWNKLHLQIIYYGREYCSARGCHANNVCPICTLKEVYGLNKN